MDDERKIEITFKTTPAELRQIAGLLEKQGCRQVRVNWYHTRLIFVLDEPSRTPREPITDIDGQADGSVIQAHHPLIRR